MAHPHMSHTNDCPNLVLALHAWLGRQRFSVRIFKVQFGTVRKTPSLSHLTMQPEPQGVVQVDNILRAKDGLLAWTNFMCSSSVRRGQILGPCAPLILISYLQVHRSWEMAGREKEYSDKVRQKNG